ncbi:hypothetical protein G7Y89_g13376 [Cudoniella acicularis]|uniref:Histone acetyltransferase type B catalytic subunit n=1 Tax=Cudoniella acicularis TaxID=354080 RepID=A0A8H4VYS1_9HELO|nr:hypothetical protein G7Y89_g13376 [Cudoniella acicularis]
MADIEADWSADSTSAVNISLVAPGKTLHTFHPKFTYSMFGEEERIFGYQGLKINLKFHVCDMRPVLQITYNKKFKAVGQTEPTDLKPILEEFLPKTAFEKTAVFEAAIEADSYADWKPPGELWKTIQSGSQTFEVWKGSLADLAVQQMVKRIQVLVPFFIEGDNVESSRSPYTFMGYSTVYRYFLYQPLASPEGPKPKRQRIYHEPNLDFNLPLPKISFSNLPCRSRISQFIILPPFQAGGNGSRFYNAIFDYYLQDPKTIEITVEDPNEAFDDLRDLNDLVRLRTLSEFVTLRIKTTVSPRAGRPVPKDVLDIDTLEGIRTKLKIAPRQFARVVEMQLLSLIPLGVRQSLVLEKLDKIQDLKARQFEYRLWQIWVKKRLHKHNRDMLMQLERPERITKLEEALSSVEADYGRLLRTLDRRVQGVSSSNGKRSSPDEEEEDSGEPSAKKAKTDS